MDAHLHVGENREQDIHDNKAHEQGGVLCHHNTASRDRYKVHAIYPSSHIVHVRYAACISLVHVACHWDGLTIKGPAASLAMECLAPSTSREFSSLTGFTQ